MDMGANVEVRVTPKLDVTVRGIKACDMEAAQRAAIDLVKGMPPTALAALVIRSLESSEAYSYPNDFAEVMAFADSKAR